MTRNLWILAALTLSAGYARADVLITEVVDGTLPNGQPKWVELTNTGAAPVDLGQYSFGNYNNGDTTLGGGASSVLSGVLDPGEGFLIAYEADNGPGMSAFYAVYGFSPNHFMGGGFVNGDDVLALFLGPATGDGSDATLVDVYGEVGVDGTGTAWECTDGYAYRCGDLASPVFDATDWTIPGPGALEQGCGGDDACEEQNLLLFTTPGVKAECGPGNAFCFGDGSGTPCPCSNPGGFRQGCANQAGVGGVLEADGSPSIAAGDLVFTATTGISNYGLFFQGINAINTGQGIPFGDGIRCVGGNVRRLEITQGAPLGIAVSTVNVAQVGNVAPGDTRYYQFWYRDPGQSPCGGQFNFTNAYAIAWTD